MRDEAGHAHERLPSQARAAHRLAVGEELAGLAAQQDAGGVVQGEEGADRQLARRELAVEAGIAVQLALRGQLRDLATDAAFRTHPPAVERLQRDRI